MSDDTQRQDEQERRPALRDDEQGVEGHLLRLGAERAAFGTEDAAAAERRPPGIRPHGELESDEPEVEGHRLVFGAEDVQDPERSRQ